MNGKLIIICSILGWLWVVLATGCSQPQYDLRLTRVSGIVSNNPLTALQILDSIDSDKLSDHDRHFYDFLSIKAKDKSYVRHNSDSLILNVLNYYSSNQKDPLYLESLYYAGRVYSDLGDYPTALQYYQKALDDFHTESDTTGLIIRLNNQIGMLYEDLRLYDKANRCYEDVLSHVIANGDSMGIVYTLQRLGRNKFDYALENVADSISNQYLNEADSILSLSLDYAVTLPESFSAMSRVFLSGIKHRNGDLKSAIQLIRHSVNKVKPDFKNVALAYATDIYLDAGITDTAFMYAHELISNDDMLNKKTGYRFLLCSELRNYLHPDSINRYYDEYSEILEEAFDENGIARTLLQDTQYNYRLHERESANTKKTNERLQRFILCFVILVLTLTIVILYMKYRNKAMIIKLRQALDTLDILKRNITLSETSNTNISNCEDADFCGKTTYDNSSNNNSCNNWDDGSGHNDNSVNSDNPDGDEDILEHIKPDTVADLRKLLLRKLIALSEKGERQGVSPIILESEIYSEVHKLLTAQKTIRDNMWNDLEEVVVKASPQFNTNLRILTLNKITELEYRAALLVKCGFKPSEMQVLLALSNGAVNSRRATLGAKILDKKHSVTFVDNIIRLL